MQSQVEGDPKKTMRRQGHLTSGDPLLEGSLSKRGYRRVRPPRRHFKKQDPTPPSNLLQASDIAKAPLDKLWKRYPLENVVHAFREAFGFRYDWKFGYTPRYLSALRRYSRIDPKNPQKASIEELSSPQGYSCVRQAGRMRVSQAKLPPLTLKRVCREVRAALVWRSLHP